MYQTCGTLEADIQPISVQLNDLHRGEVVQHGITLYCALGSDIRERDRFDYGGVTYRVTAVYIYGNVIKAEAECVET